LPPVHVTLFTTAPSPLPVEETFRRQPRTGAKRVDREALRDGQLDRRGRPVRALGRHRQREDLERRRLDDRRADHGVAERRRAEGGPGDGGERGEAADHHP
jgi:hypothetical protein